MTTLKPWKLALNLLEKEDASLQLASSPTPSPTYLPQRGKCHQSPEFYTRSRADVAACLVSLELYRLCFGQRLETREHLLLTGSIARALASLYIESANHKQRDMGRSLSI